MTDVARLRRNRMSNQEAERYANHIEELERQITSLRDAVLHHEQWESETPSVRAAEGWLDVLDFFPDAPHHGPTGPPLPFPENE
jgi:hypothetical protein